MEGGPRFDSHREQSRTPEQRFVGDLRAEANRIRWESVNDEAIEIANKIVQKIDLKEEIDSIRAHRDDTSRYQKLKQLGIFFALDTESSMNWQHEESGFAVARGESVLDLHLPPVKPEKRNLVEVTRSLELVADYIVEQNLQPKYVIGVTYEKLASVSRRQGFSVVDVPIPPEVQRGIQRVHDRHRVGADLGDIQLCFQTREAFLERYHKPKEGLIYRR